MYFVFQCFIFLDDAQGVADILEKLIKDNEVSNGPLNCILLYKILSVNCFSVWELQLQRTCTVLYKVLCCVQGV